MNKQLLIIVFTILSSNILFGQNFSFTSGAGSINLADASVNLRNHYAILNNQAASAYIDKTGVAIDYERKFLSTELNNYALHAAFPTRSGTFGMLLHHFGFDSYRQQKVGFSYGRKLLENLAIGAGFNAYKFSIDDYGSNTVFSFDLGLQTVILKEVLVGFNISNPMQSNITASDKLASKYRFGLSYLASKKAKIHAEIDKETNFGTNLKVGLEYLIATNFGIHLGTSTQPQRFAFGCNFVAAKNIQIDIAAAYNQTLGFLPALTLVYQK
jgi:hypothetical protein